MTKISTLLQQQRPLVMGIINVTPDSFSDGGQFNNKSKALTQIESMISAGMDILDIGGESTRPGADFVSCEQELERVIPILELVKAKFDITVSIDTNKAQVMQQAIKSGADMINDVRALQNDHALEVMATNSLPVCLMHMQGLPKTMQDNPSYSDVIAEIKNFFIERIKACEQAGINRNRIILDPGFGFGKTLKQNYQILAHLEQFKTFELPVLIGLSRKSMIGNLLNCAADQRLAGSLAGALIAAQNGANIIRVHDVKQTCDVLKVLEMVEQQSDKRK